MIKFESKLQALSWFVNKSWHDIQYHNDRQIYSIGSMEFMVLDETEAKAAFNNALINNLHEINYNAIIDHMRYMPKKDATNIVTYLQSFGSSFNIALYRLLGDAYVDLVNTLFSTCRTSRGKVLAKHDGIEFDVGRFYVYRTR